MNVSLSGMWDSEVSIFLRRNEIKTKSICSYILLLVKLITTTTTNITPFTKNKTTKDKYSNDEDENWNRPYGNLHVNEEKLERLWQKMNFLSQKNETPITKIKTTIQFKYPKGTLSKLSSLLRFVHTIWYDFCFSLLYSFLFLWSLLILRRFVTTTCLQLLVFVTTSFTLSK